jgi:hypothetical protein
MIKMILPILVLSLISCGEATGKKTTVEETLQADKNQNTFSQANYSVRYPASWELDQTGKMGTNFILFAPVESAQNDFRENINLIIQELSGKGIDLNKFASISENQVKTMVTHANLIESKRIINDTNEYHKIIYTGDDGTFHLQYEQYYWLINEKAYILTFTAEQNKFAALKDTAESILNSFVLKR